MVSQPTHKNGYKCLVNQFFSVDENGKVNIFGSCRSAGLGGSGNDYKPGAKKFRDGSKPYYLLGSDVAMVKKSEKITEGKVLGAFILAATEYERQYQSPMLLSKDLNSTYTLSSNESLSAEVLGEGNAAYQWYDATTSTAITGATNASYTPTKSGKYYCVITVTSPSTAAKTRAASTETYTITTSTANVTVAAAATTYTVTFNAGSNGTCSTTSITQSSEGANITLPSVTANTGYTFDGWYDAETGGTKIGDAGATYTPLSDITLYAHYTATGGSSTEIYHYTVNTNQTSKETAYTATGGTATFGAEKVYENGFKSDNGMGSTKYIKVELTGNTLQAGDVITIKAYSTSNGGGIYIATATAANSNHVDAGNLSAKNTVEELKYTVTETDVLNGLSTIYLFRNGATSNTGTSTYIQEITITRGGSSTGTSGYTITYSTSVGTAPDSKSNITTLTAAELPTLTADGYTFVGWYFDEKFSSQATAGATISANTTLYAKWTVTVTANAANGTVTITDGSGNTIESGSQVNYGTNLVFTATPNSGYKFSSWTVTGTTGTADGATYTIASLEAETAVTATFTETSSGGGNNDQKIYKYQVAEAGLPAPAINSSKYITTTEDETGETGEKLVKMTFGGWKWNGGTYIRPETKREITDSWTASETQAAGVTALDGFQYWFRGTQDAKHEKKDSVSWMYGQNRYGWFVSPTRVDGITTESHPYTLPVRGSFMTFEPTKNGTLTIYILQNGVWNSDTQHNIAIKPGEFRMHAFQITNQRGLVLEEFAPKYSVTNNQKVDPDYSCSNYTNQPSTFDNESKDVSNWKEFWDLSEAERKAVHDSWSDLENDGCQKIIKLDNGSFLAIQKAVVKYQFHVTGNETYYFFSNFSKMGFSGATFQPDAAQPTDVTTFSGVNSLSDTKAYTPIKMESDGTTIGDTGLTNYKYTINGEEVGKVTGVFIPQFKKITLNRTFKPNQWTTLSLPFNLTQTEVEQIFGKGTQIIVFDKAKITTARTYLTFFYHEIQNVLPGYPYLIRPTLVDANDNQMETKSNSTDNTPTYTITDGNLTEFTVYNKAINPHITQHEFKSDGYTAKCTPSYCTADVSGNNKSNYSKLYKEGDIFVSEGNGTVYISEGQSYGKGYRSYIDYTGTTAPAKALSISFSGVEDDDDNGTTTDIRVTELADDVIQTLGIGGVYNLNGQKVADTTRNLPAGIYIVNGKKVVVK